jgi:uncharacterized protein YukE
MPPREREIRTLAIELPEEVVTFLGVIGINWPNINEDSVREFGTHVRQFASNLDSTHQSASSTIQEMGSAYTGASYEQLVSTWANMTNSHMTELVNGCNVMADALDVAADAIVAAKGIAIAELIALAVSFVADQVAAAFTFGIAEAAEAIVIAAAKKCVDFLEQELMQHVMSEVVGKALEPLEGLIANAVSGLTYRAVSGALGGGGGGQVGPSFSVAPAELMRHADTMQGYSDQVTAHVQNFTSSVSGMSFE